VASGLSGSQAGRRQPGPTGPCSIHIVFETGSQASAFATDFVDSVDAWLEQPSTTAGVVDLLVRFRPPAGPRGPRPLSART
jgi:hypothetical protein